ncbi:hypothetical protein ACD661_11625 [Legionella lytica]|uniref:Uncharacterized protein n=1 Tax=Legionella lytica TaxID=96232 RepID=A0ABW8DAJ4_9GAMM
MPNQEKKYFAVIVQNYRSSSSDPKAPPNSENVSYRLLEPQSRNRIEQAIPKLMDMYHVERDQISSFECFIPDEIFEKISADYEYCFNDLTANDIVKILLINQSHYNKLTQSPKSLQELSADALLKSPRFFNGDTINDAVKETIEQAEERQHEKEAEERINRTPIQKS